jgi:hypothetical protein
MISRVSRIVEDASAEVGPCVTVAFSSAGDVFLFSRRVLARAKNHRVKKKKKQRKEEKEKAREKFFLFLFVLL